MAEQKKGSNGGGTENASRYHYNYATTGKPSQHCGPKGKPSGKGTGKGK